MSRCDGSFCSSFKLTLTRFGLFKAWPNARNISTQHLATFLGNGNGNEFI